MRMGRRLGRPERRQTRWAGRVMRGLRPDRNPLRRTCDRMETYALAGLFAATAAAAPFVAQVVSHAAYEGALRTQQAQLATRHQVRAVLTQAAGRTDSADALSAYVPVHATWTSVTGVRGAGLVMAAPGSPKGAAVTVWSDATGHLVSPPLLTSQVAGQADLAGAGAIAGMGALYLGEAAVVRLMVNRRRMADWDADWAVTARVWNRQRW